ncbi:MAG TPA: hypothetical protein VFJ74_12810 [Gemmatimonadaceae bacterium]|nr:hypothetical protein [Gemmatimonadaceae bacterium]
MRLWIGTITFVAGLTLLLTSRLERAYVPAWMPRIALAVTALGAGTLAATRPGIAWSVSSMSFSLIAIILLVGVIRETLRR